MKTETTTFEGVVETWSKITGKDAAYVDSSQESFVKLWGPYGLEMSQQYKFGEDYGDWDKFGMNLLTAAQLHIAEGDLVGLEPYLESVKAGLL